MINEERNLLIFFGCLLGAFVMMVIFWITPITENNCSQNCCNESNYDTLKCENGYIIDEDEDSLFLLDTTTTFSVDNYK